MLQRHRDVLLTCLRKDWQAVKLHTLCTDVSHTKKNVILCTEMVRITTNYPIISPDDITTDSFLQHTGTKLRKNKYLKRQTRRSVSSFVRFYTHNSALRRQTAFPAKRQGKRSECLRCAAVELEKIISSGGRWVDDLCMHVVPDKLLCNCNYDPHRRGGPEGMHQPLSKLSPCACCFSAREV